MNLFKIILSSILIHTGVCMIVHYGDNCSMQKYIPTANIEKFPLTYNITDRAIYLEDVESCIEESYINTSIVLVNTGGGCSIETKITYANKYSNVLLYNGYLQAINEGDVGRLSRQKLYIEVSIPLMEYMYSDLSTIQEAINQGCEFDLYPETGIWLEYYQSAGFLAYKILYIMFPCLIILLIFRKFGTFVHAVMLDKQNLRYNEGFFIYIIEFVSMCLVIIWHVDLYSSVGIFNFPTFYALYNIQLVVESYSNLLLGTFFFESNKGGAKLSDKKLKALRNSRTFFVVCTSVVLCITLAGIIVITLNVNVSFISLVSIFTIMLTTIGTSIFLLVTGCLCYKIANKAKKNLNDNKSKWAINKILLITLSSSIPYIIIVIVECFLFRTSITTYTTTCLVFPIIRYTLIIYSAFVKVYSIEAIDINKVAVTTYLCKLIVIPHIRPDSSAGSNSRTKSINKNSQVDV